MNKEYETNYNELLKVIAGAHPDTLLSIIRFAKWSIHQRKINLK
tara:strand:- start:884 stop:1015 length:132 start_codon:yes stop_codon:yes gene_type:complete